MILVTNQEDADEEKNGNGGINNQLDDPTHIGWMGGTLELEFTDHRKAVFPIAAAKRKVTLDTLIVDAQGTSTFANVSTVFAKQAKLAREIFAQELVQIDVPIPKSVPFDGPVSDVLLNDSVGDPLGNLALFAVSSLSGSGLATECDAVLSQLRAAHSRPSNTIRVIYLPFITTTSYDRNLNGSLPSRDLVGVTLTDAIPPLPELPQFRLKLGGDEGTVLMSSPAASSTSGQYPTMGRVTLAHEIGHALKLMHVSESLSGKRLNRL
jgi:hypothetical protein